ncbi:MAG: peptidoglycan-binding domain-containing protein [Gaiellaceae bacterium]
MDGRDEHGPGYDDWFDEPEPPTETQSGANRGVHEDTEEVWVLPEEEDAGPHRQRELVVAGRHLTMTQVAIISLSIVAIVLAVAAAFGAFDSGKAAVPPVPTLTVKPPAKTTTTTQTNTTPAVQAPTETLKPGDTGAQVKDLQKSLASLGFSPGTPDGDYGPSTQQAVERFQVSKNLDEDGIVGPATLAALQKAVSG